MKVLEAYSIFHGLPTLASLSKPNQLRHVVAACQCQCQCQCRLF